VRLDEASGARASAATFQVEALKSIKFESAIVNDCSVFVANTCS
jgi:hypothetical protein